MKAKNRLFPFMNRTEAKFRQIIGFFAMDFTASDTVKTYQYFCSPLINTIYIKLRKKIAVQCEEISPFNGIVNWMNLDFGARRVRGKRGRGASGKPLYLGCSKRDGNVYTEIVPDLAQKLRCKGLSVGIYNLIELINTDGWRGYDGLVDIGFDKHLRVNHGGNEFACGERHINGIESFWAMRKSGLVNLMELTRRCFICILKKRNIASINIAMVNYTSICLNNLRIQPSQSS